MGTGNPEASDGSLRHPPPMWGGSPQSYVVTATPSPRQEGSR